MGINQGGPVSNVKRTLTVDSETLDIDEINNRVGIGTTAPGTTLQLEDAAPYITLKNSTSENTAGGCESKLIFEDHGDNALGQIEVSHVGSSDDEKGQLILSTNNDSGLQAALTINEAQAATFADDLTVTGGNIAYGNGQNATLSVAAVAGTDTAGKRLTISGGQSTGSGTGGNIYFKVSDGGGSGSSANNLETAMRIFDNLSVSIFGDLLLDSDGAKLMFGENSEIVLEHDHNQGLKIASNIGDPAPRFTLESNNADAQGPQLFFLKDGSGPDNGDEVGEIVFSSEGDDAGGHTFGRMRCIIDDVGAGSESSSLLFSVAEYDGAETTGLQIVGSPSADGAVDVKIGAGAASTATVAGNLEVDGNEVNHGTGFHRVSVDVDIRTTHNGDNTVLIEVPNVKIPALALVSRVVVIAKTLSNLNPFDINLQLSATSGTSADAGIASGTEIIGAGSSIATINNTNTTAQDISLGSGSSAQKKFWATTATYTNGASDQYFYLCNAGTGNGTSNPSAGTISLIVEYYGMD